MGVANLDPFLGQEETSYYYLVTVRNVSGFEKQESLRLER